jgi:hypothetical protein
MTPSDLSDDLKELDISLAEFCTITGHRYERVLKWLKEKDGEDIPPHIPVLMALLKLPGALAVAREQAAFYIAKEDAQ